MISHSSTAANSALTFFFFLMLSSRFRFLLDVFFSLDTILICAFAFSNLEGVNRRSSLIFFFFPLSDFFDPSLHVFQFQRRRKEIPRRYLQEGSLYVPSTLFL